MKPNWTICWIRLNRCFTKHHLFTQFTRNLIKNSFFLHHHLKMVSNRVCEILDSRSRGSQAAARKRRRMLDTAWLAFYTHRAAKLNIAESNLIWVAKKRCCLLLFPLLMFNLEGNCECAKKNVAQQRLRDFKFAVWVESTPKEICRRLSDYKFHIYSLYRQLFIAKIHCHRAPKKDNEASWVNKKIMIKNTLE